MMYDTMSESFNADFEDGSVEEVIISSLPSCLATAINF